MNFFHIILGSGLAVDQNTIIQALAQMGADTIQSSNGLFTAIEASEAEVAEVLKAQAEGLQLKKVDSTSEISTLTPDQQKLIQKHS